MIAEPEQPDDGAHDTRQRPVAVKTRTQPDRRRQPEQPPGRPPHQSASQWLALAAIAAGLLVLAAAVIIVLLMARGDPPPKSGQQMDSGARYATVDPPRKHGTPGTDQATTPPVGLVQ